MTCSYDRNFCKYYSTLAVCNNDELSNCIINLLSQCCNYFSNKNKVMPLRYIIYRNGVSDSEKKNLFIEEINIIENYLNNLNNNSVFIYIVVNKKNDVKFFEINNSDLRNPCDGTIVDREITDAGCYEFYLQNQFVNQGCANPTHYHILRKTMNIPMEILQQITFHMSYYYWNWPGPTRLPACLKYAETYSKFIGALNSNDNYEIMENLKNKPFYV
jgi:hypothetical protein